MFALMHQATIRSICAELTSVTSTLATFGLSWIRDPGYAADGLSIYPKNDVEFAILCDPY